MRKSDKKKVSNLLITLLITAFIVVGSTLLRKIINISDEAFLSIAISMVEAIGLLVSLVIAIQQLKDSKEIARADFLVDLNRTFTESEGNMELYTALQNCLDKNCDSKVNCDKDSVCTLNIPKVVVSNYLTFFETVYLLEKNGVITFEMIDDLFAYRFFLAVHSNFVQQVKLAPQPENFKNIFCLEHEWLLYRKNVAGKTDSPTSVYSCNTLDKLIVTEQQKQIYAEWKKECRKFK